MTYSTKTLAKIGRVVIKQHPGIATEILKQWQAPLSTDLSKIPGYFSLYCMEIGTKPEIIKHLYDHQSGELKKIFISAMICLYNEPNLFKKVVSITVGHHKSRTTRIVDEVKFRYEKEQAFKNKVDSIVNKINQNES